MRGSIVTDAERRTAFATAAGAVAVLVAVLLLAAAAGERPAAAPARVAVDRGLVRHPRATDHVWFVHPGSRVRAFIGSPSDALDVMSRFGTGITDADIARVPTHVGPPASESDRPFATSLRGHILIRAEAGGEAWYVHPLDGRRYLLGAPEDAFAAMRTLASSIDPLRLDGIPVALGSPSWLVPPPGYEARIAATGFERPRVLALDPTGRPTVSDLGEKGRVLALIDGDGDGRFERHVPLARDLFNPHGIAFVGGRLYVAKEHWLEHWHYDPRAVRLVGNSSRILPLPDGGDERFPGQGHRTRTILPVDDGRSILVSIGSACDHCAPADPRYGSIIRTDLEGEGVRPFAAGLRNTVFFVVHPDTGAIWGNEMGRDDLGDDLPPDELNMIEGGGDYGWPYCFGDRQATPDAPDPAACAATRPPAFTYPAHSAPLGLRFVTDRFGAAKGGDLLVALHGSVVKKRGLAGYAVVRIVFENGRPTRMEDAITGFLRPGDIVVGRPVDLLFDKDGSLLITDDKAGVVHAIRPPAQSDL